MSSSVYAKRFSEYFRLVKGLERPLGFFRCLGLDNDKMLDPAVKTHSLDYDTKTKLVQVRTPLQPSFLQIDSILKEQVNKKTTKPQVALSTYMAIMDEMTTWGLGVTEIEKGLPGVSVSMQMEWIDEDASATTFDDDTFPIVANNYMNKIGRNLGFCRTEFRNELTNKLICIGTHIKFLPMDRVSEFALSKYGWPYLQHYVTFLLQQRRADDDTPISMAECMKTFTWDPMTGQATIKSDPVHRSQGGPVHGGAQAVMMELGAQALVQHQHGDGWKMESLGIEFLNAPKHGLTVLKGNVEPVGTDRLSVILQLTCADSCKSEGTFVFRRRH